MAEFLLDLGDTNEFAGRIRNAIGVGPYDKVICRAPQFERSDGRKIFYFPQTVEQYDRLKTLESDMLCELGLQKWDENGLWLFPSEWYGYIPEGYEIVDINYECELFEHGKTDNDIRFGALSFGIVVTNDRRDSL